MNWEFILKYLPMYEKAAWLTLRIGLLGIVFAIIVGFVCSTIQYYKVPVLGMNRCQTMRYIILPQAMSISVPAFVANVIFLLKETSVFSAISLMDLMFTAKDLIGLYYKTTESLFLLVVFYLILLLPISILGSLLERRLRYAGFGA